MSVDFINVGNLTNDVEGPFPVNGTNKAKFRMAFNHRFGKDKERTNYIDCEAWGPLADMLLTHAKKGDKAKVTAELQYDTWKDKDGKTCSKHILRVSDFSFEGGKKKEGGEDAPAPKSGSDIPF